MPNVKVETREILASIIFSDTKATAWSTSWQTMIENKKLKIRYWKDIEGPRNLAPYVWYAGRPEGEYGIYEVITDGNGKYSFILKEIPLFPTRAEVQRRIISRVTGEGLREEYFI